MLGNESTACEAVNVLPAAAYTAGANAGSWTAVSKYEGDLVFVYNIGDLTGSVVIKVEDATDSSGTGAADIATTASLSTDNSVGTLRVTANGTRSHVRVTATVTTGPCPCSVTLFSRQKYA